MSMKTICKPPSALKVARINSCLLQSDVAREIGKSTSFVCRLENDGSASITPEIAEKIAALVACTVELLFSGVRQEGGGE